MSGAAGTIGIGSTLRRRRRTGRLTSFRANLRERRARRARRAHALREAGGGAPSIPGSEHTHLPPRPRGF